MIDVGLLRLPFRQVRDLVQIVDPNKTVSLQNVKSFAHLLVLDL